MKWYWWVGIIIAVAVGVRVIFATQFQWYRTSGDTVSYYLTATYILKDHRKIDPWRTPVYPLILAVPFLLEGKQMPPMMSQEDFTPEFWYLRLAQGIAGIITLILLFILLRNIKVSANHAGWYTVFIACSWIYMTSEYAIVTEAFALFLLMVIMLLVVLLLRKFSLWQYILLGLLTVVAFFLRPNNILLPFIFCGVLVWHHRTRLVVWSTIALLVFYSMVLMAYSYGNAVRFQYWGISRISDVNLLGKIYVYKLSFSGVPDEAGVKSVLAEYNKYPDPVDPWVPFAAHTELYDDKYAAPIHTLVMDVLKKNVGTYIVRSIQDVPGSLMDMLMLRYNLNSKDVVGTWLNRLGMAYITIQIIDLLLFIAVPVYGIASWKKRTVRTDGLLLFSVVGLYYLLMGVFFSYNDYTRLYSIAQPFMLFASGTLLFGGLQKAVDAINCRFHSVDNKQNIERV